MPPKLYSEKVKRPGKKALHEYLDTEEKENKISPIIGEADYELRKVITDTRRKLEEQYSPQIKGLIAEKDRHDFFVELFDSVLKDLTGKASNKIER